MDAAVCLIRTQDRKVPILINSWQFASKSFKKHQSRRLNYVFQIILLKSYAETQTNGQFCVK